MYFNKKTHLYEVDTNWTYGSKGHTPQIYISLEFAFFIWNIPPKSEAIMYEINWQLHH